MKPSPPGWPRISSALFYESPSRAIDWLCSAFGFEVRIKIEAEGGAVVHSELTLDGGVIMVGDGKSPRLDRAHCKSPRAVGGANTQAMMVYVDDVEAHHQRARAAGARIVSELATVDYGEEYWTDRGYECVDLEGHHWWFYQRIRTPPQK
jgi:uncharacterized glyoxalase superfamily protein PhnB